MKGAYEIYMIKFNCIRGKHNWIDVGESIWDDVINDQVRDRVCMDCHKVEHLHRLALKHNTQLVQQKIQKDNKRQEALKRYIDTLTPEEAAKFVTQPEKSKEDNSIDVEMKNLFDDKLSDKEKLKALDQLLEEVKKI